MGKRDENKRQISAWLDKGIVEYIQTHAEKERLRMGLPERRYGVTDLLHKILAEFIERARQIEADNQGDSICIKCGRYRGKRHTDCKCEKPESAGDKKTRKTKK